MTISNTSRTAGPFIGNSITKDFPFSFKVFGSADLLVAQTDTASGNETIKTLDADYSVVLNANQNSSPGGTIRMLVAPPVGATLAITSDIPYSQTLDLTNFGGFNPNVITDAFDRLAIQIQQLKARVGLGLNVGVAASVANVLAFVDRLAASAGASLMGFIQAGIGAIKRTVQDKLRERVSVLDFGAVGDGVAIDRAAIQKGIDALNTQYMATGKEATLELPPGIYLVDAVNYVTDAGAVFGVTSVVLKDGVHLRGKGVIKVKGNAYGPGAFYRCISSRDGTRLSNASIHDITIDGNAANQVASTQCSNIVLEAQFNVSVVGVKSLNANGNGIMVRGINASAAQTILIANCVVSGATYIGIQCSQFYGLRIIGNDVNGCTDNSIDIYGESGTLTPSGSLFAIVGNVINGGLVGIFCETVAHGVVQGNSITGCTSIGMTVNRINGEPRDILISGNNVRGCPTGARVTGDTGGVLITSNSFDGFSVSGVDLGGGNGGNCSYVDVSNNYFTPAANTVAIVRTQGNVVSFCSGHGNTVKSQGIIEALLLFTGAATNVALRVAGFRVLPDQVGPDLTAKLLKADVVQLYAGGAANTPNPLDTTIPDYTAGSIIFTAYQGGIGSSTWTVPYIKRAGVLTLGAPVKIFINGEPIQSVLVVNGNARIYPQAANTYFQYGIQCVGIY